MKKFLIFLIVAPILAAGLFLGQRYLKNPKQKIPFPYTFSEQAQYQALKSPILIVGDRMGEKLARFKYILEEKLSEGSRTKISVESWSKDKEGIHRTLEKLRSLKKLPKVIIYMGASQEWYEKKFNLTAVNTIQKNLKIYEESIVRSILMFWPKLAPFFYHPMPYVKLDANISKQDQLNHVQLQQKNELLYRLYEFEFNEFLKFIKDRGSIPIIINTPINLDVPPKEVCQHTLDDQLVKTINELYLKLKNNNPKAVLEVAKKLKIQSPGNAMVYYLLGQAYKGMGQKRKAIQELNMAAALDCAQWRGNSIYNVIQKKYSAKNEVHFFDFELMLNKHWIDDTVFFDSIYPQNLYFEKTMESVATMLSEFLK